MKPGVTTRPETSRRRRAGAAVRFRARRSGHRGRRRRRGCEARPFRRRHLRARGRGRAVPDLRRGTHSSRAAGREPGGRTSPCRLSHARGGPVASGSLDRETPWRRAEKSPRDADVRREDRANVPSDPPSGRAARGPPRRPTSPRGRDFRATGPGARAPLLRLGPGSCPVRIARGVRGGRGGSPVRHGADPLSERWPHGAGVRLPSGGVERTAPGHRLQPRELDLGVLPRPAAGDGPPPRRGRVRRGRADVPGERRRSGTGREGRGGSRRPAEPPAGAGLAVGRGSGARLPLR